MPDQSAPAAAADDAVGADLSRLLAEDAPDTVFSPVSVASVLQMALCGSRGQTAAELAGALHLDGSPDTAGAGPRTPGGAGPQGGGGTGRSRRGPPPRSGSKPACRCSPTSPPGSGRP